MDVKGWSYVTRYLEKQTRFEASPKMQFQVQYYCGPAGAYESFSDIFLVYH